MSRIPFIGLTGGLGAGKSTALAALQRLGAEVLSTDAVVHELYRLPEVYDAVAERFGDAVLEESGAETDCDEAGRRERTVDRAALARVAFATEDGRAWLESLLWPLVGRRISEWRREAARREPAPRALVVEVPLLFESGSDHGFDATIAVVADEALRERRAAARGHAAVAEREARQLPQEEKSRLATYTVVNDGTREQLSGRLSAILDMLDS